MRAGLVRGMAIMVSVGLASPATAEAGDAVAGKAAFAKCAACHSIDKGGKSGIGPNLHMVFGRRAGTLEGFRFSPAMAAAKTVWSVKTLDAFLVEPSKLVPGNKMVAAPIRNPVERANLIAYIRSASR